MTNQQPEALRPASENESSAYGYPAAIVGYQLDMDTATELRRLTAENDKLHVQICAARGMDRIRQATVDELEAQLYAIGAGGVGPMMVRTQTVKAGSNSTLRAALQQARDWISEEPSRRPLSAGRLLAILTDALAASPQLPAVEQPDTGIPASIPAGWKLVPVNLTREMQAAGERAWSEAYSLHKNGILHEYRAMLAAAPKPPVVEQLPVAWTVAGQVQNWARDFSAYRTKHYVRPVYLHPQPRRQPLTNAEIYRLEVLPHMTVTEVVRIVERAHDIGQEGSAA